jgi:hypothetical protein
MATQTIHAGEVIPPEIPEPVRSRFERLADEWNEETEFVSSSTTMILNSAYQQIIGMGNAVLPLIFKRLESQGGHWFWALKHITGEDPLASSDAGNYQKMREGWLAWGRERHYL